MFRQTLPSFNTTADQIENSARNIINQIRTTQECIIQEITPETATFDNVLRRLADAENAFAGEKNILCFYQHVALDQAICAASWKAQELFSAFATETTDRADLASLVSAVANKSDHIGLLDPESRRFVEDEYQRFLLHGTMCLKTEEHRKQLRTIRDKIARLKKAFLSNISQDKSGIWFTLQQREGLPEDLIRKLVQSSKSHEHEGKLLVQFSNPEHWELLSFAKNSATWKQFYLGRENRCAVNNRAILEEAVVLRNEAAKLLGFSSYAAFRLYDRMERDPEMISQFLNDLRSRLQLSGQEAIEKLKSTKRAHLKSKLFLWDADFYHRRMVEQTFQTDRLQIKDYFPVKTCVKGVLEIFEGLFDIVITEKQVEKEAADIVWHESVRLFTVRNSDNSFLGYLYLDLFERVGKYRTPANFNLLPGYSRPDKTYSEPATAVLCSFPDDTAESPTLLRHFDTVQLFHEMGHAIHDLLSRTSFARYHGPANFSVDFGEVPSQVLENWCWEPDVLKKLGHHYSYLSEQTNSLWRRRQSEGKSNILSCLSSNPQPSQQPPREIPDSMIEQLLQSRYSTFGPLFYLEQVHKAIFDLDVHQAGSKGEITQLNVHDHWTETLRQTSLYDGPWNDSARSKEEAAMLCGYARFYHIMGEYDADYYAYLFAQVYSADIFHTCFQSDITNKAEAERYRRLVLEKGSSGNEKGMLRELLGREVSLDAFYRDLGL